MTSIDITEQRPRINIFKPMVHNFTIMANNMVILASILRLLLVLFRVIEEPKERCYYGPVKIIHLGGITFGSS